MIRRTLKRVNTLARSAGEQLNRTVIGVRVMAHCLLLYFKGGSTRFYSKNGQDWGKTGSMYIVTDNYDRSYFSKRMWQQFKSIIDWTEYYINADNFGHRVGLMLEWNIKFSL